MPTNLNDALADAAKAGLIDVVKQLLDEGVDPRADSSWALQYAAQSGQLEIIKLLLPTSNDKVYRSRALQDAAECGHLEIVRLLLPVSDPNICDSRALQYAAQNRHLEVVRLLLPFSDCEHMLKDPDFIQSPGCDLLFSCLPLSSARKFMAANPNADLPRTRAMLEAEGLRQHRVTTATAVKRRRA